MVLGADSESARKQKNSRKSPGEGGKTAPDTTTRPEDKRNKKNTTRKDTPTTTDHLITPTGTEKRKKKDRSTEKETGLMMNGKASSEGPAGAGKKNSVDRLEEHNGDGGVGEGEEEEEAEAEAGPQHPTTQGPGIADEPSTDCTKVGCGVCRSRRCR